ncbi:MAG: peroxiredoxin [Gammaproteobacteria bacterium]|nr:peroxiredoxin [Gammaproteobacteria bacterium]MDH4253270.1 peroxiredoxin [Gammaproteobacteria bacterium]MDH5308670.1 peroxiredoxin [Gammaproteobacteria bacterium]
MIRVVSALATAIFLLSVGPAVVADTPKVGDPAPGFELRDQDGQLHSLEDYRDQWVVLYFYPKDNTPGCTTEACEFRDDIFKFRKLGAQVMGVSLDDESSHREFANKYGLPFPLLADTEGTTVDAYGVRSSMLGISIAKRQTFVIDPEGRIAIHYEKVDPETHSAQLLTDLAEIAGAETN